MVGRKVRLERITDRNTKRTVIVPLVHGIGMGPIEGIRDIANMVDVVSMAGANAIVINKGIVHRGHRGAGHDIGLIVNLTGSCGPSPETQVCTVEEALKLGADAVRVSIPMNGNGMSGPMIEMLGKIAASASEWGVPLQAIVVVEKEGDTSLDVLMRGARIGAELGADIVSVPYPGSVDGVRELVNSVPSPIIIKAGEKLEKDRQILQLVKNSIQAGAIGISAGRNVFQHPKPGNMIKAISAIVHRNVSIDKASDFLKEKPLESSIHSRPLW